MPQLDVNTFSYQYVGVITLFILVYTILSYVVLPILLRLMLVRNFFLLAQQKISDLLQISNLNYKQIIVTQKPLRINFITGIILTNTIKLLKNFVALVNTTIFNTPASYNTIFFKHVLVTDFALSYLILVLSIELDENE